MLMIRFQRTGRRNLPTFRLVCAEKARSAKGKILEVLGLYLPQRTPHQIEYQENRVRHWLGKGAQMSDSAARLLQRAGMTGVERFILRYTKQRSKAEQKAEAETAPAAPAAGAEAKEETVKSEPPKQEEKEN